MTVASGGAKTSATPTSNGRPDITRCNISRVDRAPRLFLTADTCAVRRAETQTSDRTTVTPEPERMQFLNEIEYLEFTVQSDFDHSINETCVWHPRAPCFCNPLFLIEDTVEVEVEMPSRVACASARLHGLGILGHI